MTFPVQTNMTSRLSLTPLNELPANGYAYFFVNRQLTGFLCNESVEFYYVRLGQTERRHANVRRKPHPQMPTENQCKEYLGTKGLKRIRGLRRTIITNQELSIRRNTNHPDEHVQVCLISESQTFYKKQTLVQKDHQNLQSEILR